MNSRLQQLGPDLIRTQPNDAQDCISCSHCTGATFETMQKSIRYNINIALDMLLATNVGTAIELHLS